MQKSADSTRRNVEGLQPSRTVRGRHILIHIGNRWEQLAAELENAELITKATHEDLSRTLAVE
jgi:hypothetical protein